MDLSFWRYVFAFMGLCFLVYGTHFFFLIRLSASSRCPFARFGPITPSRRTALANPLTSGNRPNHVCFFFYKAAFQVTDSFFSLATYSEGKVPAKITWDDEFVDEVARTVKACAVFLYFPFFWLCEFHRHYLKLFRFLRVLPRLLPDRRKSWYSRRRNEAQRYT